MFSGGGVTAGAATVSVAVALSPAGGRLLEEEIMPIRLEKKEPLSSENMPLSVAEVSMVLAALVRGCAGGACVRGVCVGCVC